MELRIKKKKVGQKTQERGNWKKSRRKKQKEREGNDTRRQEGKSLDMINKRENRRRQGRRKNKNNQ